MITKIPSIKDLNLTVIIGGMIYISPDSIIFKSFSTEKIQLFTILFLCSTSIFLIHRILKNSIPITTRNVLIFIYLVTSVLLSSLINLDFSLGFYYLILLFITSFLIAHFYGIERIARVFNKWIIFICINSIVLFVILSVFSELLIAIPTIENSRDIAYKNLYIVATFVDVSSQRVIGIFREPGVFSVYITVALIFNLFVLSDSKNINWVLIITMLLTFSTSGYIALILVFIASFVKNSKGIKSLPSIFFVVMVSVIIVSFNFDLFGLVFNKFDSSSSSYGTFLARSASVFVNADIIINNFFFGVGLTDYPEQFFDFSIQIYGIGLESGTQSTNTFFAHGAVLGAGVMVTTLFLIWRLAKSVSNKNVIVCVLIFLAILSVLSSQDLRFSNLFNLLIFLGVTTNFERLNYNKRIS